MESKMVVFWKYLFMSRCFGVIDIRMRRLGLEF